MEGFGVMGFVLGLSGFAFGILGFIAFVRLEKLKFGEAGEDAHGERCCRRETPWRAIQRIMTGSRLFPMSSVA